MSLGLYDGSLLLIMVNKATSTTWERDITILKLPFYLHKAGIYSMVTGLAITFLMSGDHDSVMTLSHGLTSCWTLVTTYYSPDVTSRHVLLLQSPRPSPDNWTPAVICNVAVSIHLIIIANYLHQIRSKHVLFTWLTVHLNGLKKKWMMYKNIYRKFIGKNMIFWGCLNQIVGYKLLLMKLLDNQDPILQVSLFTDNIWDCPGPWQFKL